MSIIAAERFGQEITLHRKTGSSSRIRVAANPALTSFLTSNRDICTYKGENFLLTWSWVDRFFVVGLQQSPTSVSVEKTDTVGSCELLESLCQIAGVPSPEIERKISERAEAWQRKK